MAKLTIAQKKEWAQLLYTRENLPQKEIAERVGVSTVTMSKWVKAGNWEKLKVSITITREEQIKNLYRQLAELNKEIAEREGSKFATTSEADTIAKLANTIDKLERETSVSDVISVSTRLLDWLKAFDLEKAKEISDIFDGFIKDLMGNK